MNVGEHGFAGQKSIHTAGALDHTEVYSAALSLFDRISAPVKLQGTCQRWIFERFLFFEMQVGCVGIFPPVPPDDVPLERDGDRQGEKDKKRRKDTLSGILTLVHQWKEEGKRA